MSKPPTLSPELRRQIAAATFTIRRNDGGHGQCVLVEGEFILTAAHCLEYNCEGRMALGEDFLAVFEANGQKLIAATLAVEPVTDVAVLGCPDN